MQWELSRGTIHPMSMSMLGEVFAAVKNGKDELALQVYHKLWPGHFMGKNRSQAMKVKPIAQVLRNTMC